MHDTENYPVMVAVDFLRKFARLRGSKNPDALTSICKQIATMSQALNLKDNALDLLATFFIRA